MPVRECSGRILFPCPDVQGIERIKPEAVRLIEEMEELSHELRRITGIVFVPGGGVKQEVCADQLEFPVRLRLVDDDLRLRSIQRARLHQVHVDEVHAHGAEVRAGNATKPEVVTGGFSRVEILEARGSFANGFN